MTSIHGTDPNEYILVDYREDRYAPMIFKDTVLGRITRNPDSKSFAGLIRSLPDIASKLNGIQSACTIFVPMTPIAVMDSYLARRVLHRHLCDALISPELLQEQSIDLETKDKANRIQVEHICGSVMLNRRARVMYYEKVNQSFIYYIDQRLD